MKRKNREVFKQFEGRLSTAYNQDWTRGLGQSDLEKLAEAYKDETGVTLKINKSCGRCILQLMKTIGAYYFEQDKK